MEVNWSILYNIGDIFELVSTGFFSSKSGIVVKVVVDVVVESVRNDVDFIANLFDRLLLILLEEERLLVLPRSTNVGRHLCFFIVDVFGRRRRNSELVSEEKSASYHMHKRLNYGHQL